MRSRSCRGVESEAASPTGESLGSRFVFLIRMAVVLMLFVHARGESQLIDWRRVEGLETGANFIRLCESPGGTFYALTDKGGLMSSIDVGRTWTTLPGPALTDLVVLKDGSLLGSVIQSCQVTLLRSRDGGRSWEELAAPAGFTCQPRLAEDEAGILYSANSAGVHRSTDTGETWEICLQFPVRELSNVWCAITAGSPGMVGAMVKVTPLVSNHWMPWFCFMSSDSGRTWEVDSTLIPWDPIPQVMLSFTPSMELLIACSVGQHLWWISNTHLLLGRPNNFRRIAGQAGLTQVLPTSVVALNESTIVVSTGRRGEVLTTRDQGGSWQSASVNDHIRTMVYSRSGRLLAAGRRGVLSSTDGGWTWTEWANDLIEHSAVAVVNGGIGQTFALSGVSLHRSGDAGVTWQQVLPDRWSVFVEREETFKSIFVDWSGQVHVWGGFGVAGPDNPPRGAWHRSVDGGITWSDSIDFGWYYNPRTWEGTTSDVIRLTARGTAFRVKNRTSSFSGPSQMAWRTSDRGGSWTVVRPPPSAGMGDVDESPTGSIFAGPYRSRDGGETWTLIAPDSTLPWRTVCTTDGAVVALSGRMPGKWTAFLSNNEGDTWLTIPLPDDGQLSEVCVHRKGALLVITRGGEMLMSAGGSNEWCDAGIPGRPVRWICIGEDGKILATTSSGIYQGILSPLLLSLLRNPGFESGTDSWNFFSDGSGTFAADGIDDAGSRAAHVAMAATASNSQLYQRGIRLLPNSRYRLRFQGYSSSGTDLAVLLHKDVSPYTNYGLWWGVDLGTEWETHEHEFVTGGFSEPVADARLRFWLAPFARAGDQYYLDDVILEYLGPAGGGVEAVTGVGEEDQPVASALLQNYPNPFNPSTTITFTLPRATAVRLSVFDLLGREIAILVDERRAAGVHRVRCDASGWSSGVYLYRLWTGDYVQTRKFVLVR